MVASDAAAAERHARHASGGRSTGDQRDCPCVEVGWAVTGGQVADCRAAAHLLSGLPVDTLALADEAYEGIWGFGRCAGSHGSMPGP